MSSYESMNNLIHFQFKRLNDKDNSSKKTYDRTYYVCKAYKQLNSYYLQYFIRYNCTL